MVAAREQAAAMSAKEAAPALYAEGEGAASAGEAAFDLQRFREATGGWEASAEAFRKAAEDAGGGVLVERAVAMIRREGRCTVPLLEQNLRIDYSRAVALMGELERRGYVGPMNHKGNRVVNWTSLPMEETAETGDNGEASAEAGPKKPGCMYAFLAYFPLTGAFGIHDLYVKRYIKFIGHVLLCLTVFGGIVSWGWAICEANDEA